MTANAETYSTGNSEEAFGFVLLDFSLTLAHSHHHPERDSPQEPILAHGDPPGLIPNFHR